MKKNSIGWPAAHLNRALLIHPLVCFAVLVFSLVCLHAAVAATSFSDANWISMGGIPGANGPVDAAVVDDSGNLYIGGSFTRVGDVVATNVAKWNGRSWSALGSGMNGTVDVLVVSGSDVYAG